jgi:hypothetical protein
MAPRLSVSDRVDDTTLARIEAGLAASDPTVGPYVRAPLAVLLHDAERDGTEALVGGLIGETVWQWLSVRVLWVDPARRRAWPGSARGGRGRGHPPRLPPCPARHLQLPGARFL